MLEHQLVELVDSAPTETELEISPSSCLMLVLVQGLKQVAMRVVQVEALLVVALPEEELPVVELLVAGLQEVESLVVELRGEGWLVEE